MCEHCWHGREKLHTIFKWWHAGRMCCWCGLFECMSCKMAEEVKLKTSHGKLCESWIGRNV